MLTVRPHWELFVHSQVENIDRNTTVDGYLSTAMYEAVCVTQCIKMLDKKLLYATHASSLVIFVKPSACKSLETLRSCRRAGTPWRQLLP